MNRHLLSGMNRRELLKAAGLAGGAYFLPSLLPRAARAAGLPQPPKRLVIFWTIHGTMPQFWVPKGVGQAAATETQFAFPADGILAPLTPFKDKITLLAGLDFPGERYLPRTAIEFCPHGYGTVQSLTGQNYSGTNYFVGTSESIDNFILSRINAANGNKSPTRAQGLYFTNGTATPFFGGPYAPNYPHNGAQNIYDSDLFPTLDAADEERRKDVLSFVGSEYEAVKARLSGAEKTRVQQHSAYLSQILGGVGAKSDRTPVPFSRSQIPYFTDTQHPAGSDPFQRQWMNSIPSDVSAKYINTCITAALQFDMTRVVGATYRLPDDVLAGYGTGTNPKTGKPLQTFQTTDSHAFVHATDRGNGSLRDDPAAMQLMKNYHVLYAEAFADLLQKLDSVKEPDGSTLLDNSMVLWCGEFGEGGHNYYNCHWLVAGSGGGAIKTGRYLTFGDPLRPSDQPYAGGATTNDLHCTLATAMGFQTQSFGVPAGCKGPISSLLA